MLPSERRRRNAIIGTVAGAVALVAVLLLAFSGDNGGGGERSGSGKPFANPNEKEVIEGRKKPNPKPITKKAENDALAVVLTDKKLTVTVKEKPAGVKLSGRLFVGCGTDTKGALLNAALQGEKGKFTLPENVAKDVRWCGLRAPATPAGAFVFFGREPGKQRSGQGSNSSLTLDMKLDGKQLTVSSPNPVNPMLAQQLSSEVVASCGFLVNGVTVSSATTADWTPSAPTTFDLPDDISGLARECSLVATDGQFAGAQYSAKLD